MWRRGEINGCVQVEFCSLAHEFFSHKVISESKVFPQSGGRFFVPQSNVRKLSKVMLCY